MQTPKTLLIAALSALSLSFAPAPAVASENDDLAKLIAGLLAAGIVVSAVNDRKDRNKKETQAEVQFPRFGDSNSQVINGRLVHPKANSKALKKAKKAALPASCLRTLETRKRDRAVYTQACLNRHYRHAQLLPEHCTIRVRAGNRIHTVYGAECLARDGWKTASYKRRR